MIKDFSEKNIRNAILNKIKPKVINKNGKHWKGSIYLNDKFILKVKIPNEHPRIMKQSKSMYIAQSLRLTDSEFNEFVECTLKGPEYYKIQSNLETITRK